MSLLTESIANVKETVVTKVPEGSTAILNCESNDYDHNFMVWIFGKGNAIGPGNPYDEQKYKYEVLSGKLHINDVAQYESGSYKCLSKKLDGSGITVGEIEMIVQGTTASAADIIKFIAIIISIIVIVSCAVLYYRLRREWNKYDGRSVLPAEDVDDDDGEEVYNPTTTSISQSAPAPSRNPSSEHLIYGIDNQGLDTDFNSVFENIQIKTPHKSLI